MYGEVGEFLTWVENFLFKNWYFVWTGDYFISAWNFSHIVLEYPGIVRKFNSVE